MKITVYKKEFANKLYTYYHLYLPDYIRRLYVLDSKVFERKIPYNFLHGPRSIRKAITKLEKAKPIKESEDMRGLITILFPA
jgi:hypothetical protein